MESQKPKVAMYVKRSFGDKLNASFDFIKENWKILLKFTTYLLLPVSLIQALSLNGLMGGAFAMTAMSKTATVPDTASLLGFMSYYGLYMIVFMIGSILLTSMIYALIRTYNEREERLEGITLGILKPLLFRNIKRLLVMTLHLSHAFRGACGRSAGVSVTVHLVSDHSASYRFCSAACIMGTYLPV